VLQCDAVCCSVLQCVAVSSSVLQCDAVVCQKDTWNGRGGFGKMCVCSVLQCVAVCCSVLQCVAVLQCVLVLCVRSILGMEAVNF